MSWGRVWEEGLTSKKPVWNWPFLNKIQLALGIGPTSIKYRQTVLVKIFFFLVLRIDSRSSLLVEVMCYLESYWILSQTSPIKHLHTELGSQQDGGWCFLSLSFLFLVWLKLSFFLSLLASFHNLVVHGRSVIWFSPLHSLSHFCRQKWARYLWVPDPSH